MNRTKDTRNTQQVDAWIRQNLKSLPSNQIGPIFCVALQKILNRTLVTLSEVTLNAVLDRVLYQSQKEFPQLSGLEVKNFQDCLSTLQVSFNEDPTKACEAFRFFLIELLNILENLTAGIIMEPLYQELSMVTAKNYNKKSSDRGNA